MSTPADGEGRERTVTGNAARRPGHELGAARERAGFSTEEMASRLHLSREHLDALERDDYQHLPAATFVRGYLRAYAREVGMDGDELVAEFDAICEHPDAPELVIRPGVEDPARASASLVAVLILVAVVVIGALAWWFQQGRGLPPAVDTGLSEPAQETDTASTGTGDDAVSVAGSGSAADTPTVEAEPAGGDDGAQSDAFEPSDSTAAGTDDVAAADDVATADDTTAAGVTDDVSASGDEPEAVVTGNEAEPTGSADEQDAAGATEDPESDGPLATSDAGLAASDAAATGPDRLEIRVEGESWLEVYDTRGRQLVYTLYSGSAPVVVNGWAPFDVYLGNAPDVTVEFGDTVIDHSAFVRSDNTAGFRADADGARSR